jgi:hypothetical protein
MAGVTAGGGGRGSGGEGRHGRDHGAGCVSEARGGWQHNNTHPVTGSCVFSSHWKYQLKNGSHTDDVLNMMVESGSPAIA